MSVMHLREPDVPHTHVNTYCRSYFTPEDQKTDILDEATCSRCRRVYKLANRLVLDQKALLMIAEGRWAERKPYRWKYFKDYADREYREAIRHGKVRRPTKNE